ncbi:MAG: hypothetical protein IKJ87_04895 [Ruminococcus sp.]|nr:hypothetical protein [Ruminococcus sp.]
MISPIIEFSVTMAENTANEKIPVWAFVVIAATFVISSAAAGIISYKIKLKQLTENKDFKDADENE